jgi:type II secretory pathway pseudopilin PulG
MSQPVVVSARTLVALVLAVALLSTGIAIAVTSLTQPERSDAAKAQAARVSGAVRQLRTTNRQLRKANSTLRKIHRTLGPSSEASINTRLERICVSIRRLNGQHGCPAPRRR